MKPRLALALAFALSVLLIVTLTAVARDAQPLARHQQLAIDFVGGEVLLKLRPGTTLSATPRLPLRSNSTALNERLTQITARTATAIFAETPSADLQHIYRVQIDPDQDVMAAIKILEADPNVEYAEPNYIAHAAIIPNDPLYSSQWALATINAPAAWDVVTGTPGVVIAIIDSGIDTLHPDLAGHLWFNPGEIPDNGIDDDNNGFIDDVNGWNFVGSTNNIADDNGHGTQVAGMAGASTNNAIGMAGMCWNCRLMIVKAMQASGVANYSDIAAAVNYAAAKGAQVINISLGGYANSATLRAAIEAASTTTVIVGGAGNDNVSTPFYPAAYADVLAVASTTNSDTKAAFSDYGLWVDVAAPGVAISTTFSGGDYGTSEGTSLSTPLVAGLAGLIKTLHPDWSPALVQAQIVHTTDAITETQLGSGRINAATAMLPPQPLFSVAGYTLNGTPNGRPELNSGNALVVNISNDWLDATNVVGTLSESDPFVTIVTGTASFGNVASGAMQSSAPFSFTVASGAGYNHPITLTLGLSANGGAYTAALPLTITTRSGEEPVAGTIAVDTLWTNDKTYVVNSNIGIAPGVTLTIQPGTVIQFNGNYNLNVGGTLIADGTAAQPIRFESKMGGLWGQIGFADSSSDASVDAAYDYLSGSILRHVVIDKALGIGCSSATPYLSYLTFVGGRVDCTPGILTIDTMMMPNTAVLFDSHMTNWKMTGTISFNGNALVWRNVLDGNIAFPLSVNGQGSIRSNASGRISGGAGSVVQDNVITGGITIYGAGTITQNTVSNGSISVGGGNAPSVVLTNTIRQGGINTNGPDVEVRGNDVTEASGWGIATSGLMATERITITHNRLVGNANGIQASGEALVQGNLIANSTGTGLQLGVGAATILSNTLTGNRGSAILIQNSSNMPTIHGNNFEGNLGAYDIENLHTGSSNFIQAQNNWWGITNTVTIADRVYDFGDDFTLAIVQYQPVLNGPVQDAPAYMRRVTVLPDSTLGIQTGTFEVQFSRPMNTGGTPQISFVASSGLVWTGRASLPTARSSLGVATANNGKIYAIGGYGGQSQVEEYNPTTNAWAIRANMPTARKDLGVAAASNGRIYAIGGEDIGLFATVEEYNPAIDTWTTRASMPTARKELGVAAASNGKIYAVGGRTYSGFLSTVEEYDPATNTWATRASMPTARAGLGVVATSDGKILALGGFNGSNLATVEEYDPATDTWTIRTNLPNVRSYMGAARDSNNKIYAVGGISSGIILATVVEYNPATGAWTTQASMPTARYSLGLAATADGRIYAIGGDNSFVPFATVEEVILPFEGRSNEFHSSHWTSTSQYRASYDINALIPRGAYSITVGSAVGLDGIAIAPNSAYTSTVDYAGGVVDTTPPPAPAVSVDFCANSTTSVSAQWLASDPNSAITLYRYALGSSANNIDVINWTDTGNTSITRTGLNLVAGQRYSFSVKARNAGGLWSAATSRSFTAGVPCQKVYLPLVRK